MRVEAAAGGESLLTDITDVGPLAGVNTDVSFEQAGPVKYLATGVAGQHGFRASGRGGGEFDWWQVVVVVVVVVEVKRGDGLTR